jgi:hypothetical protein
MRGMERRLLVVAWFAVACGGGSGSSGSPSVDASAADGSLATHHITYMFNGTTYSGSLLATATLQPNGAGGNALGIEASDSNGNVLAIAVQPATPQAKIAIGTFATGSAAPLATFQFSKGSAGTWAANGTTGSGSIEITALTATDIEGTFSATMNGSGASPGSGPGTLTSGTFDLAIP